MDMRMRNKHTQGPWVLDSAGKIVSEDHVICDLRYPIYPVSIPDELSANARLIAAAPELLEVCEIIAGHCQGDSAGHMRYFNHILSPIISKAKGGAE